MFMSCFYYENRLLCIHELTVDISMLKRMTLKLKLVFVCDTLHVSNSIRIDI